MVSPGTGMRAAHPTRSMLRLPITRILPRRSLSLADNLTPLSLSLRRNQPHRRAVGIRLGLEPGSRCKLKSCLRRRVPREKHKIVMDGVQELAVRVKLCHLYGQLLLRSAAGDALTA